MATNLVLDDNLIQEAVRVGGPRTKKAAVTHALEEYIQRRMQREILDLFGKIDLPPEAKMKRQRASAQGTKRRASRASARKPAAALAASLLREALEDAIDLRDARRVLSRVNAGTGKTVSAEEVFHRNGLRA